MGKLDGKVVLITGSNRGIGKAIARSCANEGASLTLAARGTESLEQTANEITKEFGVNVVAISTDVSQEEEIEVLGTVVKSPIVGTAYLAPEPGGKKFVDIGKKIKKGDTIMIVEAMKTMNHVPSPSDGIVKEISVEDGQPVEFGQKLLILE